MGKAYLFVPTGEIRPPKKGEWAVFNTNKGIGEWEYDAGKDFHVIVTRHEIEIPEDTKDAYIAFSKDWASLPPFHAVVIPIPKPKKKVKKWRWWADLNGIRVETAQEKSEDEMVDAGMQWHKISSSEVEVEVG